MTCEALMRPQMAHRGLEFQVDICPMHLAVKADAEKLQQILLNLLTNAIKFTDPKGKITLECERAPQAVRVHVRDTGRGIPEDKLLEIFEPFVQVARSAGSPGEGVGLGLAISRELSRAMGGELVAQSQIGVGSIFTLTLPSA
jgi:signal transduction histidine kinase